MESVVKPRTLEERFGQAKMFLFAFLALLLSMSFFMAVFSPLAMGLVFIIYGKKKGLLMALATLIVMTIVSLTWLQSSGFIFVHIGALVFAYFIGDTILSNLHPIKGIMKAGAYILLALTVVILFSVGMSEKSIQGQMIGQVEELAKPILKEKEKFLAQGGNEARQFVELLEKPEVLAEKLLRVMPAYLFVGVFFVLWLNMFLLLRGIRGVLIFTDYPYRDRDLMGFKLPDLLVWGVIAGLALFLGADYFGLGKNAETLGMTVLYCLGIFYFFQGVGVLMFTMNIFRFPAMMKSFILMLMIVTIPWLLAGLGVFDTWADFRTLILKKKMGRDKENKNNSDSDKD